MPGWMTHTVSQFRVPYGGKQAQPLSRPGQFRHEKVDTAKAHLMTHGVVQRESPSATTVMFVTALGDERNHWKGAPSGAWRKDVDVREVGG